MFNVTKDTITKALDRGDMNAILSHPVVGDLVASSRTLEPLWRDPDFLKKLDVEIIIRYADFINWRDLTILRNIGVPDILAESRPELFDWNSLVFNQILDEDFIIRNLDRIDLGYVNASTVIGLSSEFVLKHYKEFGIAELLHHKTLPESFYDDISNTLSKVVACGKTGWSCLVLWRQLSEEFIEKHYDKFDIIELIRYQNLSVDFIRRHLKDIDQDKLGTIVVREHMYRVEHSKYDKSNINNLVTKVELDNRFGTFEEDDCDEDEHAHWYESDEDSAAYIRNRPTFSSCDDCCD